MMNRVKKRLLLVFLMTIFSFILGAHCSAPVFACTAFCIKNDGKMLVGNSDDYWVKMNSKIRFYPAEPEKHGRVFFIWDEYIFIRLSGMNDQGLMFDILLTPSRETNPAGWYDLAKSLTDDILENFSTVAETRAYLDNWSRRPSYFMQFGLAPVYSSGYQVFFADKSGASMVYGGGRFIENTENYNAVANEFLFDQPFEQGTNSSYYRQTSAFNMVKNIDALLRGQPDLILTPEHLLPIFERVDHRIITTSSLTATHYTYIMDLTDGLIYIQMPTAPSINSSKKFMNYNVSAVLDLHEETGRPVSEYGEKKYIQYNIEDLPYDYAHSDEGISGQFDDFIPFLKAGATIVFPRFNVVPGSNIRAEMTGLGDADLYLAFGDVDNGLMDYSSTGSSSNEVIDVTVPDYAHQAFLFVRARNESENLDVAVDYVQSSYVPSGEDLTSYQDQIFACADDYAVYGPFDVKIGSQFQVTTKDSGNVDIYAYVGTSRSDQQLLASSETSDSVEAIDVPSVPGTKEVSPGVTKMYLSVYGRQILSKCDIMIRHVGP